MRNWQYFIRISFAVFLSATGAVAGWPTATETAGGIRWRMPEGWEEQAARPTRIVTYRIPAVSGDPEDGECIIYYSGHSQAESVDTGIARWAKQFRLSATESGALARIRKRTVRGLVVTTLDISGTYLQSAGKVGEETIEKPAYRLIGAIVEAPEGHVFFKLTGPARTINEEEQRFKKLVGSVGRK